MELQGEIVKVIFTSSETGYTVLDMKCEDSIFTVVGTFPPVSEGQMISVEGSFKMKTQYGKQFLAERISISQPSRITGIVKFLSSGLIHGLGPVTAEAIVNMYGVETLEKMKYPMEIAKVRGVSLKKATDFCMSFVKLQKMQDAIIFLQKLGITINLALKIYKVYESKTEDNVRKNPYMLVDDIDGVGFTTADRIAGELGIKKDSDYRICAAITYLLKEAATRSGHNYLPDSELVQATLQLLALECENPEERVRDNIEDMIMLGDLVRYDTGEHIAIMLKKNYYIERNIARKLLQLRQEASDFRVDADDEIKRFEKTAGFELHKNQAEAVKASIENGVHIVTGGPGTGKTTIVKCILNLFKNLGQRVALCAPTGRASKRLGEATGEDAKTIHRLLDLDFTGGKGHFNYNEDTRLAADVVIVDEVSMCDEYVFYALVRSIKKGGRLILVGDKDQLPSVGAGNVLADIISCDMIPINYLTRIYRQSDDSLIIENAHKVNSGVMPTLDNKSKDFFFDSQTDTSVMLSNVINLTVKRLSSFAGITPKDIQVLCPTKKGVLGVENINVEMQKVLNPPDKEKNEIRSGVNIFRTGDKIIHLVNNYQMEWYSEDGGSGSGVFNGDIGYITYIDKSAPSMKVEFDDGRIATYKQENFDELTLAYAISIHKSQGSEFPAVIITASGGNPYLMTRNLLYTAITRAKSFVVIEGTKESVAKMVKNDYTAKRNTMLAQFICGAFE